MMEEEPGDGGEEELEEMLKQWALILGLKAFSCKVDPN